jgi:hypothetical protein
LTLRHRVGIQTRVSPGKRISGARIQENSSKPWWQSMQRLCLPVAKRDERGKWRKLREELALRCLRYSLLQSFRLVVGSTRDISYNARSRPVPKRTTSKIKRDQWGWKGASTRQPERRSTKGVCPKSHGQAQITSAVNKAQLCHKKEPRSYPVCGAWGFVSLLPQT